MYEHIFAKTATNSGELSTPSVGVKINAADIVIYCTPVRSGESTMLWLAKESESAT